MSSLIVCRKKKFIHTVLLCARSGCRDYNNYPFPARSPLRGYSRQHDLLQRPRVRNIGALFSVIIFILDLLFACSFFWELN